MSLTYSVIAIIFVGAVVFLWSQKSDLNICRTLKFWIVLGFCYSRFKVLFIPFIVQDLFHSLHFSVTWRLLCESQLELYLYILLHFL